MNSKTAISSWSGGKDSCLAYYKAKESGYTIKCLLNFITREHRRGCFHGIEAGLLRLQAERLGVNLVQKEVSPDMQKYEGEFKEAVNGLRGADVGAMVFGDIYLLDQINWVERVCRDLTIVPVEPLWDIPPLQVAEEFIDLGFKAIVVSCKADRPGKDFIGRYFDKEMLKECVRMDICPCGENGEFHTLVIDGPPFRRRIDIVESEPILKEGFWKHWFLDIKRYA